jgi:transcriptional regulator with XRE-family HTH domain
MMTLQYLRQQRSLSKAEVARLAYMLLVDYSLAEKGLLVPTAAQAERLERVFNYPIPQLLAPIECPAPAGVDP